MYNKTTNFNKSITLYQPEDKYRNGIRFSLVFRISIFFSLKQRIPVRWFILLPRFKKFITYVNELFRYIYYKFFFSLMDSNRRHIDSI